MSKYKATVIVAALALVAVAVFALIFRDSAKIRVILPFGTELSMEGHNEPAPKPGKNDGKVLHAGDDLSAENRIGGDLGVMEPEEDANFTEWASKTAHFAKSPARVRLCRTARPVFVKVDAVQRQLLVDGKPFAAGDVRVISNTCKVTDYSLTEPRKWQSGGTLQVMYREKR